MPPPNTPLSMARPVWYNTYWVKNALEQYEAIFEHAGDLNHSHKHFWGLTQKFALEAAAVNLCKIYDNSCKKYSKHTVYELFDYLQKNISSENVANIQRNDLIAIGIRKKIATQITKKITTNNKFEEAKAQLIAAIQDAFPKRDSGTTIDKLFIFRDKVLVHQEQLEDALKEQVNSLPLLEDMFALNDWANKFCKFFVNIFEPNTALLDSSTSARMATKNVIKEILGITFDDKNYEEQRDFFIKESKSLSTQ